MKVENTEKRKQIDEMPFYIWSSEYAAQQRSFKSAKANQQRLRDYNSFPSQTKKKFLSFFSFYFSLF